MNRPATKRIALCGCLLFSLHASAFEVRVNKDARRIADFEQRVSAYVKLHKKAQAGLPQLTTTESPEKITDTEGELAARIRALRRHAKQGEIFTPQITREFHRLIGISWQGSDAAHMKATLQRSEPVQIPLHVNSAYPAHIPLQSTPPTLLQNLPVLPKELEYRVVSHRLVLRDVAADLIVDFTEAFIP